MSEKKSIPYGTIILFAFWVALLLLVLKLSTPAGRDVPPELEAVLWPKPKPLQPFSLADHNKHPFNLSQFKGKWSFLFFGYTYCPDICPTTLTTLRQVYQQLKQSPDGVSDIQVIFVSVDPERDQPEVLAKYVNYFDQDFIGVTGEVAEIDGFAQQMNAAYIKEAETAPGQYLITHASSIFLVDPQVRLYAVFSQPHDPATIVDQYQLIRNL